MSVMVKADYVLQNGNVITLDPKKPRAEAVAIRDGKFLWVGTNDEVKAAIDRKTQLKDLDGMTVVPGFNDSHHHTIQFGHNLGGLDLRGVQSVDDMLSLVEQNVKVQAEGTWILGSGYNQNELAERRHPTRWDLDKVAPNHPVAFKHTSGHNLAINSKALDLAGITKETADPENGRIDRDDETQEPTGLLFAFSAMKIVSDMIPKPSYSDLLVALKRANGVMVSEGITSATDARVGLLDAPRQIGAYQEAVENGILQVRHTLQIWSNVLLDFANIDEELKNIEWGLMGLGLRTGIGNHKLRIGAFKFVTDGALSTATSATYEPYGADPKRQSRGVLMIDPEILSRVASAVHRLGWQISIHAIGDRAIDAAINAIERSLKESPRTNSRPRIEHVALATPEMLERISRLQIITVLQPTFLYQLGDNWISQLGYERAKKAKPFRRILDQGLLMAFSSDRPAVDGAPLLGIHSSVNEMTKSGRPYAPDQKISVEEALRCYTVNGAYASFEENIKGSIEPGKLADIVVLADNIFEIPTERIKDTEVVSTMIDGNFVYQK
jgi:predicted amidohydrolase YtcJ